MKPIKFAAASTLLLLAGACARGGEANNSAANAGAANVAVANDSAATAPMPGSAAAATADVDGARQFIDAVYRPYVAGRTDDYFRHFTPELRAAIDRAGEGAVEADPLCECQDFDRFTYRIESVESEQGGLVARVAVRNSGEANTIVLHLVKPGAAWLIADVGDGADSFARGLAR